MGHITTNLLLGGNGVLVGHLITNKENCPLQKCIYETQKDFIEIPTDTISKLTKTKITTDEVALLGRA